MQIEFKVPSNCENWFVKDFLRAQGVSTALIRAVKYNACGILKNSLRVNTNERVHSGDSVIITLADEKSTSVIPQSIPLKIAYESSFAMVVNKPFNMPVHPTRGYIEGTLANGFCGLMNDRNTPMPFRAVNRLDKNTSGLVLIALNSFAAPYLSKSVEKEYFAIIQGEIAGDNGEIDAPIRRCENSIITQQVHEQGKRAVTIYEVLAKGGGHSLIKVIPVTGRTHQIRVHFAHIGHPLAGDDLYGASCEHISRHALHCGSVKFKEPLASNATTIKIELPFDMVNMLSKLKID